MYVQVTKSAITNLVIFVAGDTVETAVETIVAQLNMNYLSDRINLFPSGARTARTDDLIKYML